jgi:hypothetical protein
MIDRIAFDFVASRIRTERTVIRDGVRRSSFFVRLPSASELADWLLQAGFAAPRFEDGQGQALTPRSRRMVAVATA